MMIELSRDVPGIWIALEGGHYEEIEMSITIGSSYSNYAINTNETSSTERASQLLKKWTPTETVRFLSRSLMPSVS